MRVYFTEPVEMTWNMTTPRRQFSRSLANNRWVKVWRRWQRKDVIVVNENHRRYRALECIREGIKDLFEKHPELGVKVRVTSYILDVMKSRYIYCNRRSIRKVSGWTGNQTRDFSCQELYHWAIHGLYTCSPISYYTVATLFPL